MLLEWLMEWLFVATTNTNILVSVYNAFDVYFQTPGEEKSTSKADDLHSTPTINAKRHKLSGFQKLVRKFRFVYDFLMFYSFVE